MRFILSAGQRGDAPQASALIEGLPAQVVMADTAYDADHFRQAIAVENTLRQRGLNRVHVGNLRERAESVN